MQSRYLERGDSTKFLLDLSIEGGVGCGGGPEKLPNLISDYRRKTNESSTNRSGNRVGLFCCGSDMVERRAGRMETDRGGTFHVVVECDDRWWEMNPRPVVLVLEIVTDCPLRELADRESLNAALRNHFVIGEYEVDVRQARVQSVQGPKLGPPRVGMRKFAGIKVIRKKKG